MVAIGGDYAILLGDSRFHSDRHRFLAVVEVAETADQLRFVERIGGDLHPTHHRHISEEGYELFGGGGDGARRWFAVVAGEGDTGLDGDGG